MFYDVDLHSRLMLGTAQYPSPAVLAAAIEASGAEVITVSLRREGAGGRRFATFCARAGGASCPTPPVATPRARR